MAERVPFFNCRRIFRVVGTCRRRRSLPALEHARLTIFDCARSPFGLHAATYLAAERNPDEARLVCSEEVDAFLISL
eukprot:scaffold21763_cov72-Skeletonema_dohrnii-CCMP3373.AAC.3